MTATPNQALERSAPRFTFIALILWIALWFPCASNADAPATKFFAIETAKLTKLAPTDADLDSLSSTQLSEASIAHGWYGGGLSMMFDSATFRIDARFSGSAYSPTRELASIGYNISASNDQTSWSLLSAQGAATKQGKQFVTENWRKQPVTIILRYLNLKK
jgi:hypothetical protein